ncbi:flagellar assembly protein FliW [Metabacillus litoralis]|uniref:flagellar assembly protein FliW n=1 Tax=Metabacillus litoralis TaxID=152268 RepID=UPI000EF5C5EC|nr:flagellar assembly protein FliW [Metabacillus litoralis]
MEINTKYHGVLDVEDSKIVHFEQGIPGFLDEKDFILLPIDNDSPFSILQSVQTSELGFVVTEPFIFFKDYEFDLGEHDKEVLGIADDQASILVLAILSLKDPFVETTANLQAPIVINQTSKKAKQVILVDESYTTKHKILKEVTK